MEKVIIVLLIIIFITILYLVYFLLINKDSIINKEKNKEEGNDNLNGEDDALDIEKEEKHESYDLIDEDDELDIEKETENVLNEIIEVKEKSISEINKDLLMEIKDRHVIEGLNRNIPKAAQVKNSIDNAKNAAKKLYEVIIPQGEKLDNALIKMKNGKTKKSKDLYRAMYRDKKSPIKGHALLKEVEDKSLVAKNVTSAVMNVGSMVVGEYYMNEINEKLGKIENNIDSIKDFQESEYKSKFLSLVTEVKHYTLFFGEIKSNEKLLKINLNEILNSENKCKELLGQANEMLLKFTKKINLKNYEQYELELKNAQDWYMYQKNLLSLLEEIGNIKYSYYSGEVSHEYCFEYYYEYERYTNKTIMELNNWHEKYANKYNINLEKGTRDREGFNKIFFAPISLFNSDLKYIKLNEDTKLLINEQTNSISSKFKSLYNQDVKVVVFDNKYYYELQDKKSN